MFTWMTLLYATSFKEYEKKYNLLVDWLRKDNLKLQSYKCEFLKTEIIYLGHVINKVSKTNVNADALSRNPVDFKKENCNIINYKKFLNPDNQKDTETISKMLEESAEKNRTKISNCIFPMTKKLKFQYLTTIYLTKTWTQYHSHTKNSVSRRDYKLLRALI